jgi:hypothetical protein
MTMLGPLGAALPGGGGGGRGCGRGRVVVLGDAVARHDIDWLLWGRRPDQAAAFGFQLRTLRGFQGLLGEVAQAGVGVAVAQGRWAAGCLTLALRLPFGGCFGALGAFRRSTKLRMRSTSRSACWRLASETVSSGRTATVPLPRAGRIGNFHLAAGQTAFVDFGAGRLGEQQAGKKGQDYPVHGFVIA